MDYQDLLAVLARHGLEITTSTAGCGHFRDLHVGVGQPLEKLSHLRNELAEKQVCCEITYVTNHEHPDYGQRYVLFPSFWCA